MKSLFAPVSKLYYYSVTITELRFIIDITCLNIRGIMA